VNRRNTCPVTLCHPPAVTLHPSGDWLLLLLLLLFFLLDVTVLHFPLSSGYHPQMKKSSD